MSLPLKLPFRVTKLEEDREAFRTIIEMKMGPSTVHLSLRKEVAPIFSLGQDLDIIIKEQDAKD